MRRSLTHQYDVSGREKVTARQFFFVVSTTISVVCYNANGRRPFGFNTRIDWALPKSFSLSGINVV